MRLKALDRGASVPSKFSVNRIIQKSKPDECLLNFPVLFRGKLGLCKRISVELRSIPLRAISIGTKHALPLNRNKRALLRAELDASPYPLPYFGLFPEYGPHYNFYVSPYWQADWRGRALSRRSGRPHRRW